MHLLNTYDPSFQICTVSFQLVNSALNLDCSTDELTKVENLDEKRRCQVLDRCGLFGKNGVGFYICNSHFLALTTNFKKGSECMAENHAKDHGSRRLSGTDLDNARPCGEPLSKHILETNKFLIPVGSHICSKCRKYITATNPMPKTQKLEPIAEANPQLTATLNVLNLEPTVTASPQPNSQTSSDPESVKSAKSDKNDVNYRPASQEVQTDRRIHLNGLLDNNFKKARFKFRMDKPLEGYSYQEQCLQMDIIASCVEAVINTVSEDKPDHINIWRRLMESHCMEKRLENSDSNLVSMDSLIRDIILAYNKCVSYKHRIQVRSFFYSE